MPDQPSSPNTVVSEPTTLRNNTLFFACPGSDACSRCPPVQLADQPGNRQVEQRRPF